MSNKTGYFLGICSSIIYTIIIYGFRFNYFFDFIGSLLGTLLIPTILAGIFYLFSKKNFGKIFGITCIVINIVSAFGHNVI